MVLGGSFEFWKTYNKDIIERESDDIELPPLIKHFKNLGENKKEQPLSKPYSIKARLFIHAHLSRFDLPSQAMKAGMCFFFLFLAKPSVRFQKFFAKRDDFC